MEKAISVLCNKRVPIKLEGKIHKAVVLSSLMLGFETKPIKMTEKIKMDVAEMKMLRWFLGVTKWIGSEMIK